MALALSFTFRALAIFIKNNLKIVLVNLLGNESDPSEKSKRHIGVRYHQ